MSFIYISTTRETNQHLKTLVELPVNHLETVWHDETRNLRIKRDASTQVIESSTRLMVCDGEYIEDHAAELLSVPWANIETLVAKVRGNAIVISKTNGESIILTDTMGSFPLFYGESHDGRSRVYSPMFRPVRDAANGQQDFTGIYQYLAGGYTIGARTLHTTVRQFLPGEFHHLYTESRPDHVVTGIAPNPWATASRTTLGPRQVTEAIDAFRQEGARLQRTQLMFSAGWDSRTILAGILDQQLEGNILAYSHGDTSSRELRLARAICVDHRVSYLARELDDVGIDLGTMDDALEHSGHTLFPHWRIASKFALDKGYRSLSGGIFGGILGGHYSVPSVMKGKRSQFASLIKYLYFAPKHLPTGAAAVDIAHHLVHRKKYIQWWCLKEHVREKIRDQVLEECALDTRGELERLRESGVDELDRLVEAYQVGQRGRQYMNGQLGICRSNVPLINPFINEILVSLACGLPLREKVHNQVNRVLLSTMAPSLLKYPMAATFLPASTSIGLQELSRGIRKMVEASRWQVHQVTSGKYSERPNMGWVNFEFLRKNDLLDDLIESLQAEFWDRARMRDVVKNHSHTSMHPLFDMFCKIKTIDYQIAQQ